MKATKKIVGAAVALVAAVALSAGSTFAWFVSNGSVTATGMEIQVSTTNSYLIIGDKANDIIGTSQTTASTMTLASATTAIYPSAHIEVKSSDEDTSTTNLPTSGTSKIAASALTTVNNWYYGVGTTAANGALTTYTTMTDATNYIVQDDIYVGIATGASAVTDLKVSLTANPTWTDTNAVAEGDNSAISVVFLYEVITKQGDTWGTEGNAYTYHEYSDEISTTKRTDPTLTGVVLNETSFLHVHLMVYFDGNNSVVKGNNAKLLGGTVLSLTFTDSATGSIAYETATELGGTNYYYGSNGKWYTESSGAYTEITTTETVTSLNVLRNGTKYTYDGSTYYSYGGNWYLVATSGNNTTVTAQTVTEGTATISEATKTVFTFETAGATVTWLYISTAENGSTAGTLARVTTDITITLEDGTQYTTSST